MSKRQETLKNCVSWRFYDKVGLFTGFWLTLRYIMLMIKFLIFKRKRKQ